MRLCSNDPHMLRSNEMINDRSVETRFKRRRAITN